MSNLKESLRLALEGEGTEDLDYTRDEPLTDDGLTTAWQASASEAEIMQDAIESLESVCNLLEAHRGAGLSAAALNVLNVTVERAEQHTGFQCSREGFDRADTIGTLLALESIRSLRGEIQMHITPNSI